MTVNGYTVIGEWKNSQCGETALAKKGGKKYFLKKYNTPAAPVKNGTLDAKTFAHNQKLFDHFVKTRTTVNSLIRTITGSGGNIVIPEAEFMIENKYAEAAEFVEGVVPEEELEGVLRSLSVDVKKLLMQTAAGALSSVHKLGIVHSDLKLKNVLLVRNAAGNYVAKLIDFDSSYPLDDKPDEIVGDVNYYSPELGLYSQLEDEEEMAAAAHTLTQKSDIFSLGLIFHFYLSGELPEVTDLPEKLQKRAAKGKKIYAWVAVNAGAKLKISPAIDKRKYRSLIEDMLKKDPEERPTALEVLKRLKEEERIIEEPWPEHGISFNVEKIKSRGFVGVSRFLMDGIKGYRFYRADFTYTFFRKEMVVGMGYAGGGSASSSSVGTKAAAPEARKETTAPKPAPEAKKETTAHGPVSDCVKLCDPWPEHRITFDPEVIGKKGFSAVARDTIGGVNGYRFSRPDGSDQFIRSEMAVVQKMARKE
ncbi:MAG: protein kinase [Lachnospiraceae bacterium]|nr:protein kinase [Lachnospiraceae bacterium]